jgi:hypothetical protein
MGIFSTAKWAVAVGVALASGLASAATVLVAFPEVNGQPFTVAGPFPQPPLTVATRTFAIPSGDRVVAATISGYWGSSGDPNSTAGVTVAVDGVEVAKCVKPDASCWTGDAGQRPWTHTFTPEEMLVLNDGVATMTALQTSDERIRLGVATLIIETAPPPGVPTLSAAGLGALLTMMLAAGAVVLRRRRVRRS